MSLGRMIRDKRQQLNLTLDEVAAKVGFSKPYLSTIETGKVINPPSDELLRKLEKVLGFEQGLLLYAGHMERVPPDIRDQYEIAETENKKWRQLVRNLKSAGPQRRRIDSLLSRSNLNTEKGLTPIPVARLVPIINRVAAGYPTDFDDLNYPVGIADDYIRCPDLSDPNAFAVRVVGDSMEPKYQQGDIVIFSPAAEVRSGDDCFVRFSSPHETTFKRVYFESDQKLRLQPRNDTYPPQIVEGKRISGLYRAVIKHEML